MLHDDIIKWKHFPRYWPFVLGFHQSPVNSPHTGQWCRALMFSLICDWINSWVNNREAGDLRHHRAHYDIIVMYKQVLIEVCGGALMHSLSLIYIYLLNQVVPSATSDESVLQLMFQHVSDWAVIWYHHTVIAIPARSHVHWSLFLSYKIALSDW